MILRIDGTTRIRDIQSVFTSEFGYLHLEFFKNPHQPHQASPKKDMRSKDEFALSADKRHAIAEIEMDSSWKVRDLEETFFSRAGLNVQVFRKSGNVWIETSLTDDWTLEQQNREGELFSTVYPPRSFDANVRN